VLYRKRWNASKLTRFGAIVAALLVVGAIGLLQARSAPSPAPQAFAGADANPTSPPSDPTAVPSAAPDGTFEPLTNEVATDESELADLADLSATASGAPQQTARPIPVPTTGIATRVVVSELGIDIPVTRQTTSYPACDVAMYIMELKQPGQGGVTYLYAHARTGNFLPLLTESLVNDGRRMIGMTVEVYTGESLKFTYRITEVRRHATSLDEAFSWHGESVWLQTSEGTGPSVPKLQVIADLVSRVEVDFDQAHPAPYPVRC
jgi:hypothetical protein